MKERKKLGREKSSYKHREAILVSTLACDARRKVIWCPHT